MMWMARHMFRIWWITCSEVYALVNVVIVGEECRLRGSEYRC